jgi:phosphoserine aminotransferase
MSERAYNFSAGPAMMPAEVLEYAQEDLLDYKGTGIGVAEIGHRSDEFLAIADRAEADLRDLLAIPDNYRVLFLQGGATGQFSAIPLNLTEQTGSADYVVTGIWSKKAVDEGRKFVDKLHVAGAASEYTYVPNQNDWQLSDDPAYVHITPNETINGVAFAQTPEVEKPLVGDMSSVLLSEPFEIEKYGVIYAGAQKNIGPAGLTLVIVRDDLLEQGRPAIPAVWDWKAQAEAGSKVNTPPTVSWYMAGLVFKWLKKQGGVSGIAEVNRRKAGKLYAAIDDSELYSNPVEPECRSLMNVPFVLAKSGLEKAFLRQARSTGLVNLEGHRSVGGLRASIYNAMPEEGVDKLVDFMRAFEEASS